MTSSAGLATKGIWSSPEKSSVMATVCARANNGCASNTRTRSFAAESAQLPAGFGIGDHRTRAGVDREDHPDGYPGLGAAVDDQRVVIFNQGDLPGDGRSGHDAARELLSRNAEVDPAWILGCKL